MDPLFDFTGKVALITGGSRGLGRNAAIYLAKAGVNSIITYNSNKDAADETLAAIKANGAKGIALQLDTSDVSVFDAFTREITRVLEEDFARNRFDFLLNNAGTGVRALFSETTEEQFDDMMNIHLKGVFFLTQKLAPLICDGGRILNVSSGLARFSFPGSVAYAVMKGGVEVLTRYLARELGARGISANTLAPGAVETDFRGGEVRDNREMNAQIGAMAAMGRVGLPDDIGPAIASLFLSESNWITGQRIEASGGMLT